MHGHAYQSENPSGAILPRDLGSGELTEDANVGGGLSQEKNQNYVKY